MIWTTTLIGAVATALLTASSWCFYRAGIAAAGKSACRCESELEYQQRVSGR